MEVSRCSFPPAPHVALALVVGPPLVLYLLLLRELTPDNVAEYLDHQEPNFAWTPHVVELFNTISALAQYPVYGKLLSYCYSQQYSFALHRYAWVCLCTALHAFLCHATCSPRLGNTEPVLYILTMFVILQMVFGDKRIAVIMTSLSIGVKTASVLVSTLATLVWPSRKGTSEMELMGNTAVAIVFSPVLHILMYHDLKRTFPGPISTILRISIVVCGVLTLLSEVGNLISFESMLMLSAYHGIFGHLRGALLLVNVAAYRAFVDATSLDVAPPDVIFWCGMPFVIRNSRAKRASSVQRLNQQVSVKHRMQLCFISRNVWARVSEVVLGILEDKYTYR